MFVRKPLYLMAEAEGTGEGPEGAGNGAGTDSKPDGETQKSEKTFTQADVDRIIAGRFSKFADYDEVKAQLTELQQANQTESEKALNAARQEGEKAAQQATAPRLVAAEFRVALAGRRTAEQVAELIEDLDLSKYLTEAGEVDVERVAKKADILAPADEERKPAPTFGGGARKTDSKPESTPGIGRLRDAYAKSQ